MLSLKSLWVLCLRKTSCKLWKEQENERIYDNFCFHFLVHSKRSRFFVVFLVHSKKSRLIFALVFIVVVVSGLRAMTTDFVMTTDDIVTIDITVMQTTKLQILVLMNQSIKNRAALVVA